MGLVPVFAGAQRAPASGPVTAIRAGRFIDVAAGRSLSNQIILVSAGKITAVGAMTGLAPDIQLPLDLRYGEAKSPWEVRQRIRELAHHGAEGIRNAIRAGVASVEHATLIDDDGIALAKQHGTYLDMDIYDEECIQSASDIPADFLQHDRGLGEAPRRNFTKAVRAGVCPHGINARQFAFMVKYGMTPMQAIQSATVNAAGNSADIIAVRGDPLDDVRALEQVSFVMKQGKVYKQED
jgi:imidazolonepropionase-like amidohydrolase